MNKLYLPHTVDSERPYSEDDFGGLNVPPLLLSGDEAERTFVDRQDAIARMFGVAAAFELRDYTSRATAAYVGDTVVNRMQQSEARNAAHYIHDRLNEDPDYSIGLPEISEAQVKDACEAALHGTGTQRQNFLAMCAYGMESFDLGCLTVVGSFRHELGDKLIKETSEFTGVDAAPRLEQMESMRVLGAHLVDPSKGIENPANVDALRIGMKRVIATMGSIEILGRTTAIINTKPEYDIAPSDLKGILSTSFQQNEKGKIEHIQNRDMADNPYFQAALYWLIESGMPPGLVLARYELIYAHNRESHKLLRDARTAKAMADIGALRFSS